MILPSYTIAYQINIFTTILLTLYLASRCLSFYMTFLIPYKLLIQIVFYR